MFKTLATGTKSFKKGEIIMPQGVKIECLYLLQSGSCYRYLITDKGDNIIYEIKEAGNTLNSIIDVLAIYNQTASSAFTFVARTNCECLCIPVAAFLSWAEKKADIQNQLLRLTLNYYDELRMTYQAHQEGRVANHLCIILLKCSSKKESGWIVEKKYSFAEMASMIGIHAVTVSRIFHYLLEENILCKESGKLRILDMERFLRYATNKELLPYK